MSSLAINYYLLRDLANRASPALCVGLAGLRLLRKNSSRLLWFACLGLAGLRLLPTLGSTLRFFVGRLGAGVPNTGTIGSTLRFFVGSFMPPPVLGFGLFGFGIPLPSPDIFGAGSFGLLKPVPVSPSPDIFGLLKPVPVSDGLGTGLLALRRVLAIAFCLEVDLRSIIYSPYFVVLLVVFSTIPPLRKSVWPVRLRGMPP